MLKNIILYSTKKQKSPMEFFDIDDNKEEYDMKSGTYKKVQTLGEGAFGKVLKVQKESPINQKSNKKDSYYFALKISKRFRKKKKIKKNLERRRQKRRRNSTRNKLRRTPRINDIKKAIKFSPYKHRQFARFSIRGHRNLDTYGLSPDRFIKIF